MVEEKRPFAEIEVAAGSVDHYLLVAGEHVDDAAIPFGIERLKLIAERINAAVEAREAPMRALIGKIRERLTTAVVALDDERISRDWFEQPVRLALKEITAAQIDEAVSGDVAMGLAFDLGAEKERTAAFAPLLDQLLAQGGEATRLAFELARALGLKIDTTGIWMGFARSSHTDDELRAECRRRGWHPEMGLAPRFDPPMIAPAHMVLGRDEAALVQYDRVNAPRSVVRIRNIDLWPLMRIPVADGIPVDDGIVDEPQWAANCANRRCSRFGTRHPGIPCDSRRGRGIAGKR